MIDIKSLRDSPDIAKAALGRRLSDMAAQVDQVLSWDRERRSLLQDVEELKAKRNRASKEIAAAKRLGEDTSQLLAGLKEASDRIKKLDQELREIESRLRETLLRFPNFPLPEVPAGDDSNNRIIRSWGEPPEFAFTPRAHWDLGELLGILDLTRGARISGSGFPVFRGLGARLTRALVAYMIDVHVKEHGYTEIAPPYLVTAETALGTGQLPDHEGIMYRTEDGLYLIPTAEVPVTNLHRGEILKASDLPVGYVAYSPCFRREAGAHGKDTRGIIRVHQFDKVELVRLTEPQHSAAEHELLLGHAERILQDLGLPYRVVLLAAGDIGLASAKTYDLEVWAPGAHMWLEVSSASTFTDYQARRANIRYRPRQDSKPSFVHTLNASGLALPRTIIAILENYQQEDGSVVIPDQLVPYLGTDRISPGEN